VLGDGADGECEEEEDPAITAKRTKLQRLEHALRVKEDQFTAESNWMSQAEALVGTLRKKVGNVKLHLHDLHKSMTELHFDERKTRKELHGLEDKHAMGDKLKDMERELSELLSHSESVKAQVSELNGKKEEYKQKIEELRNVVAVLKTKNKVTAESPTINIASPPACPCHLPATQRPHCGCY